MAPRALSRFRLLLLTATAAALLAATPTAHGQPPTLPTAAFDLDITTGVVPLLVTLTDRSQNAAAWSWDFGDGATSDAQNPTHLYTRPGLFDVQLTVCAAGGDVGDAVGCDTTSATIDVAGRDALDGGHLRGSGTVYGAVNWAGDEDLWTFDAHRGDRVAIALEATSPFTLDPVLRLFGPSGDLLAFNDDDFTAFDFTSNSLIAELPLPTAGRYSIQTTAFFDSIGPYALTLTLIDVNAPRAAFEVDRTSGAAPLPVQFTNRSRSVTSFAWDFGDGAPAGEAGHETAATDRNPQHTYAAPGSYTVTLTACRGAFCDDASLTITVESSDGGALDSTAPATGAIEFPDDSDRWTFTVPPGAETTIAVTALARELDLALDLFDAQGNLINFDDDSGGLLNPLLADLTLPAGVYTLELFNFAADARGDYTITLTINTEPIVRAFAFVSAGGPFVAPAIIDFFDASLGQPTSWTWDFGDGTTATARDVTHQFTQPGIYTVRLDACNARSCDTWRIRLAIDAETDGGAIALDQTVAGAIDPGGDTDAWTFQGTAGQIVTITVFADDLFFFDPTLELTGPDGSLVATDDDSGGDLQPLIADLPLPTDGLYTITVRAFDEFATGRYQLDLSLADSATPIP